MQPSIYLADTRAYFTRPVRKTYVGTIGMSIVAQDEADSAKVPKELALSRLAS